MLKMRIRPVFFSCVVIISTFQLSAADHGRHHDEDHHNQRQHKSHMHGVSELNIVSENNTIEMELISPSANFLGFEHRPKSEAQQAKLDQLIKQLNLAQQLFEFSGSANCDVRQTNIESELLQSDAGHGHKRHDEESHSGFHVEYKAICKNRQDLTDIKVNLFSYFPGMETINVQLITENAQRSMVLKPDSANIAFR